MKTIYLIGPTTGAAQTQSETTARDYEMTRYHKCTREEFLQRIQEMRALDLPSDPTEFDRTASNLASATPASTPAPPLAGCQQPRQRKEPL